jgi:MraZ protein
MPVNDFSGAYRLSLDSKKRISIPSGIRKMLTPESDSTMVFTRGFEGCVYVYPHDEWRRLTQKLNALDSFDVNVRDFIRLFVGPAYKSVMDTQGRMVLPDYILEMAKVERDILFLGSLNKWELWNPEVYDRYIKQNNPSLEKLTKEINFNAIFKNDG